MDMEIGNIYEELSQNNEFHTIVQILNSHDDDYVSVKRLYMWEDTGNYFYVVPHRDDDIVMSIFDLQKVDKSQLFWALFHKIIDKA